MRLLQVSTVAAALEAFLVPFARHFRKIGWEVHCAAADVTQSEICAAEFDGSHDVPWSRNPLAFKNLLAGRRVRAIVDNYGFDIVHVHTPVASFVTRAALRRTRGRPAVVYTAHGFHFFEDDNSLPQLAYKVLERVAGPWTDQLVVINSEDERSATKFGLVPQHKLRHVPGIGMDSDAFRKAAVEAKDRATYRRELGIATNERVILMVAEFTPNKRHVDVIDAVAAVQAAGVEVRLVLAGVGPTMETVVQRATSTGIADRVRFLGFRRDVPGLMKMADVLVLASDREGLPRSIMEAMAAGLPAIGTKIRGVEDLLVDGAGVLIPPRDSRSLAQALIRLLDSPAERHAMVDVARRRVERFSIAQVLEAYEEVYSRALFSVDEPPPPGAPRRS